MFVGDIIEGAGEERARRGTSFSVPWKWELGRGEGEVMVLWAFSFFFSARIVLGVSWF